ncbi:MAG: FMN-binding protein [Clostridia bacterium]|nr:FMN-binding protein [Clostridia bacterium]
MKIKDLLRPTLILVLICVVVTAALSVTNYFTKDTIALQKQQAVETAMKQLIPNGEYTDLSGERSFYSAKVGGKEAGYIAITQAMGYKDYIQVMTAFDITGRVMGVNIIDCADESPGIGQKVGTDQVFQKQFVGITQTGEATDAITGATISSKGVQKAVDMAIERMQQHLAKGVAQ